MGRFPDFLIIGAMKCGTTSLHQYLGLHEDIMTTDPKEIHFFNDGSFSESSIESYKVHFSSTKKLVGASPQNYTKGHHHLFAGAPKRLKKYIPNVKLIYIVRDPIIRYRSHLMENFFASRKRNFWPPSELEHFLNTGMYYQQISYFLDYFPENQVHILCLEDLMRDDVGTLNRVFQFLEVPQVASLVGTEKIYNDSSKKILPAYFQHWLPMKILKRLAPTVFEGIVHNEFLMKYYQTLAKSTTTKFVNEDFLREKYASDVASLESFLGKKLDIWQHFNSN